MALRFLHLPFEKTKVNGDEINLRALLCGSYRMLRAMTSHFSLVQKALVPHVPTFLAHTEVRERPRFAPPLAIAAAAASRLAGVVGCRRGRTPMVARLRRHGCAAALRRSCCAASPPLCSRGDAAGAHAAPVDAASCVRVGRRGRARLVATELTLPHLALPGLALPGLALPGLT